MNTVTAMMMRPGAFFEDRLNQVTTGQAWRILLMSAVFFSAASALVNPAAARIGTFTISLVNAIGMAVLGTGIAHLALIAITGKRFALARLWPIFSLSASVVLVLAWIPAAIFFTEPWRWWLIGTGLVRGLGLSKARATMVVLATFGCLVMMISAMLLIIGV